MLVEILVAYALTSNEPLYLRTPSSPYMDSVIQLHVNKDLGKNFYIDLLPYVMRSEATGITGRAGAEASIGVHFKDLDLELYHHSSHNLDVENQAVELDMVRLRWTLIKQ
jgi:hypothetical protein